MASRKGGSSGTLAASLAHAIDNPLASVRNTVYLLDHAGLEGDQKESVRTAGECIMGFADEILQVIETCY